MATDRGEMVTRLLELALERGAIRYGDFTLSSGRKSAYYFDGRLISLDPEGAYLLGHSLLPLLTDARVSAVGGPTLGADPIVAAVATASWQQGTPIPAFIVRKEAKGYGTGQMIEGPAAFAGFLRRHCRRRLYHRWLPVPRHRRRRGSRLSRIGLGAWRPWTATRAAAKPSASAATPSPPCSPPAKTAKSDQHRLPEP